MAEQKAKTKRRRAAEPKRAQPDRPSRLSLSDRVDRLERVVATGLNVDLELTDPNRLSEPGGPAGNPLAPGSFPTKGPANEGKPDKSGGGAK